MLLFPIVFITFAVEFQDASHMNALDNAHIMDQQSSKGPASFAFPEAKSSQTGVSVNYAPSPDRKWYVLRTLYGHARQAADFLIEDGAYVYLAMIWKDERKDGRRRRVLVPFMNLLFAYLTEEEARKYVSETSMSRFITYYYNHFATDGMGYNPPLTVSSKDMIPLIRVTAMKNEHVMEVDPKKVKFVSNDLVRVTDGPFEGIEGRVARVARQSRVVIFINGLQSCITTAYIPAAFLQKIE